MAPEPQQSAGMLVFFHVVFLAVCLLSGVALVHEGHAALRDGIYTLKYTESSSWATESAFSSNARDGVVEYRGGEATQFGVGFCAFGIMLLAWAAGLASSLLGRIGVNVPDAAVRVVAFVALAALLVGCVALFPPWRRHTMPLYFVVAAFTLAVTLPIPDRARKTVFPAVVGLVILVGMTGFPAFPIFAGIFVFLIAGANLLVLSPGLRERIERMQVPQN